MTKSEAILDKVCTGEMEIGDNVYTASEALQAQRTTAIEFGEFMRKYTSVEQADKSVLWWDKIMGGKSYTEEQLFDVFNNQV